MEHNMDGEINHQLGEWEKHEKDWGLLEQLELHFHANRFLPRAEERKARAQKMISDLPEVDLELWHDMLYDVQIHKLICTVVHEFYGKNRRSKNFR